MSLQASNITSCSDFNVLMRLLLLLQRQVIILKCMYFSTFDYPAVFTHFCYYAHSKHPNLYSFFYL